jgi:hypothetical protein
MCAGKEMPRGRGVKLQDMPNLLLGERVSNFTQLGFRLVAGVFGLLDDDQH